MPSRLNPLRIAAVVAFLNVLPAFSQVGTIQGNVVDQNGAPIRGAVVNIVSADEKRHYRVKTDVTGYFEYNGLPAAEYEITVVGPDGSTDETGYVLRANPSTPDIPITFTLTVAHLKKQKQARPQKQPRPPTQPDFTEGCVTVSRIYSHSLSSFSGVGAPEPGLEANVYNTCTGPVDVFLTIAYFDSCGVQFDSGMETQTVAPGANCQFYHEAPLFGLDRGRMKVAKIIKAQVFEK